MEDNFPHRVCFLQMSGWNPCVRTYPTMTDRKLVTGDSPSMPIIHIKTQVSSKGPKCVLSCSIPALYCHLSTGMAEDRLLCQVRALRFYLERSMSWREHKRLLFVSFKSGHKRDIVPFTISGWIRKTVLKMWYQLNKLIKYGVTRRRDLYNGGTKWEEKKLSDWIR